MDSINSILGDKDFSEPGEMAKLKDYIRAAYNEEVEVRLSPKGFVITVPSSALASSLRLSLPKVKRELNIKDSLIIRIR